MLNSLTPAATRTTLKLHVLEYNGRLIWPSPLASRGKGELAVVFRSGMLTLKASICAAVLTGLANSSFASCGDWLAHAPNSSPATAPQVAESVSALIAGSESGGLNRHRLPRIPCTGPKCRNVPTTPDAPIPPATSIYLAKFAISCSMSPASGGTPSLAITAADDARAARGFPELVEHPPRA
jgi:hypothetical protein